MTNDHQSPSDENAAGGLLTLTKSLFVLALLVFVCMATCKLDMLVDHYIETTKCPEVSK